MHGRYDFDDVVKWMKDFHVLTPITYTPFLDPWLRRLKASGLPMNDKLIKEGKTCFYSCSCSDFMHYAFCVHSCVMAMTKQLVTGYPPTLDPRRVNPNANLLGRPAKVKPGSALVRES